jgi:hypothetical protein
MTTIAFTTREGLGDGLANPLAAAGDKGRSSVKLQIH